MKRVKSVNGYTIYQATARDVSRYNVEEGYFYLYFSSDIRAYGIAYSYIEAEAGSLEEAEAIATGSNYAIAREYVEASTTAADYAEIAEIEKQLDEGMTIEEIEEAAEEAAEAEEIAEEAKREEEHARALAASVSEHAAAVMDPETEEILAGSVRAVYYALQFRARFDRRYGEPAAAWRPAFLEDDPRHAVTLRIIQAATKR